MKLPHRRQFLRLATGAAVLPAVPVPAWAQSYPTRPITIVVPFPAGGATDSLARVLAERMKGTLGQPVIIENVSGASGSLGVGRVARAAPDGYTLCIGQWGTHVANGATLTLQYDVLKDFEPVALLTDNPMWIVAGRALPPKNVQELISWMKENPGKATVGTVGAGTGTDIVGTYFQRVTGTSFRFVPYRGAAQLTPDLIAGQIDLTFTQVANTLEQVRGGQMKAYAVLARTRWWAAADVPTMEENGAAGLHASIWHGLWAPKGTSKEAISKVNASVQDALADPSIRQKLSELGQEIFARDRQTPEALAAYQNAEIDKWWPIIKAANIRAE
jgi:tripartite-type tricarboxylate transporter receptor subunit TctC